MLREIQYYCSSVEMVDESIIVVNELSEDLEAENELLKKKMTW